MVLSPYIRRIRESIGTDLLLSPAVAVELTELLAAHGGPQFRVTYPNGDEVSYVSVLYEARVVDGRPQPDHDETTDVGWFHLGELAELDLGVFARHTFFMALGWLNKIGT